MAKAKNDKTAKPQKSAKSQLTPTASSQAIDIGISGGDRQKIAEKRAVSLHHVRSAASASPNPAPTHTPSTFEITGTGHPWTARTASASTRIDSSIVRGGPPTLGSDPPLRSAPAQKSPPAPVRTTTRTPE